MCAGCVAVGLCVAQTCGISYYGDLDILKQPQQVARKVISIELDSTSYWRSVRAHDQFVSFNVSSLKPTKIHCGIKWELCVFSAVVE
jgi:hypothetical protein